MHVGNKNKKKDMKTTNTTLELRSSDLSGLAVMGNHAPPARPPSVPWDVLLFLERR